MEIYVVVAVFQGVVSEVKGFMLPPEAEEYEETKKRELGIVTGHEEESENDVQTHEIDVDVSPRSTASIIGNLTW